MSRVSGHKPHANEIAQRLRLEAVQMNLAAEVSVLSNASRLARRLPEAFASISEVPAKALPWNKRDSILTLLRARAGPSDAKFYNRFAVRAPN